MDGCIFTHGLCTIPCQPSAEYGQTSLGENELRYQVRSVQYFSCPFPVIWSEAFGGLDSTHTTVAIAPSICNFIFSLSGQQLGDTSAPQTSREEQRHFQFLDSAPETWLLNVKTLQHVTSRLLNFSNLTLSHSET